MDLRATSRRLERALLHGPRRLGYVLATAAVIVATLVRALLLTGSDDVSPFQTFILAVIAAGLLGGFGPGLWATLLGGLIGTWLWLPPLGTLSIPAPDDLVRLLLFVAAGAAISGGSWGLRSALEREEVIDRSSARIVRLFGRVTGRPPLQPGVGVMVEALTDREIQVLRLVALGLRNGEVARTLVVSENTVKTHLSHAFGKLGVRSRTEAVSLASALGLLASSDRPVNTNEAVDAAVTVEPAPAVGGSGRRGP
jgi:DNA-binding CsgD family transcriptional regulator